MKRVYIAGPYRAATPFEVQANIRRACQVRDDVLREGHLPITPHLLTGHCDGAIPDEQLLDGLVGLMLTCHEVRVVPYWEDSAGTCREIAEALAAGLAVHEHPHPSQRFGVLAAITREVLERMGMNYPTVMGREAEAAR